MCRNWKILRLYDLYRTAGHTGKMTPAMAREIRKLGDELK